MLAFGKNDFVEVKIMDIVVKLKRLDSDEKVKMLTDCKTQIELNKFLISRTISEVKGLKTISGEEIILKSKDGKIEGEDLEMLLNLPVNDKILESIGGILNGLDKNFIENKHEIEDVEVVKVGTEEKK